MRFFSMASSWNAKIRPGLPFYARQVAPVITIMLTVGCSKPAGQTASDAPPPAPASLVADAPDPPKPVEPSHDPDDGTQPASVVTARAASPSLPETESGLEIHYFLPSTPPAERVEVIHALGQFQTVSSVGALARIFAREKRLDAKMQVIEVVADNREESCREGKLSVLRAGVADTQSRRIRLAALQALLEVADPRLPQILQPLARDQDPLIRSQAAEALRK
jgi:hypothetical protein